MMAKFSFYHVIILFLLYFVHCLCEGKLREITYDDMYSDVRVKRNLISPSEVGRVFETGKFQSRDARKAQSNNQRRQNIDPSKVDLVFLSDKYSRNVRGSSDFYRQKSFILDLVDYLPVFPAKIRVAVVSISSGIKLEFDFQKFINKECTAKAIQDIRYTKGQSSLSNGLEFAINNLLFDSSKGARSNAKKVIIVLSKNQLDVKKTLFLKNLSNQRGVQIAFVIAGRNQASRQSLAREILNVMSMENFGTLVKLGNVLGTEITSQCETGKVVYDECRRRCNCVAGKLMNCYRIRVQFTEMSEKERARYIEVVKTASTHHVYRKKYEALLTIHKTIFRTGIHQAIFFLPWHRWFILQYENLLREIDCGVTVPYWESAEEANDALASDVWNTGEHGFGGNGTGSSNCVQDGPFRAEVWSVIESAGGGCLTRNFNGRFPDCITVMEAILEFSNVSSFEEFEYFLHREFHDAVHCVIGGQMCSDNSATSPEFFLHHGFVDKLWSDWQRQSTVHTNNDHFTAQTVKMPATNHLPKDLLDLMNQPGCVSVKYRDPGDEIYQTLLAFSKKQIENMPRVELPPYPESARKLFEPPEKDMQRMKKIRSFLQPLRVLREEELTGQDRVLGFRKEDLIREWARGLRSSARTLNDERKWSSHNANAAS